MSFSLLSRAIYDDSPSNYLANRALLAKNHEFLIF